MIFLSTDMLNERLELFVRERPSVRGAFERRLRALRDRLDDGGSKRLRGPGDFFESDLDKDLRLLWRRGCWRGRDAIYEVHRQRMPIDGILATRPPMPSLRPLRTALDHPKDTPPRRKTDPTVPGVLVAG